MFASRRFLILAFMAAFLAVVPGVTLSRDDCTRFVANGFGDDVTIVDVRSRKATQSIPVGPVPWGIVIDD